MTGAGVSRAMADLKFTVSADAVNRHKQHYTPEPTRPKGTRKGDFAVMIRDKMLDAIEDKDPDHLLTLGKEYAPMVGAGLKAQAILDKRELAQKKTTQAEALVALLSALRGEGRPVEPLALDDGLTIEGEAVVIED